MSDHIKQWQFGELLKARRVKLGATQRQLADLSTVSIRAIRDLELGRAQRPRRDTVRLIADGLGLRGRDRADFEAYAGRFATKADLKLIYESEPAPPPAPLDALVGREMEVALLRELLASGDQRFITTTGLSGVGKSRLAIEVAGVLHRSHSFSVLWSSSSEVTGPYQGAKRPDQLSALIRTGLDGLTSSDGAVDELAELIDNRPSLIVLDGYERARIRADRLVELLTGCRGLRVLTTARAPLDIHGERTFPLAPLAVPESRHDYNLVSLAGVPATQLFIRYIRHVRPAFELTPANAAAVAALCRRLDGIPAALEAAASWLLLYEPRELLAYLQADPFGVVGDRLPELRELLRHTVSGLDTDESAMLLALSDVDADWSMSEAVELTGIPAVAAARLVRRLSMLGLIRSTDETDRARFLTLNLVRALDVIRTPPHTSKLKWCDLPSKPAQSVGPRGAMGLPADVLPPRVPLKTLRAG